MKANFEMIVFTVTIAYFEMRVFSKDSRICKW